MSPYPKEFLPITKRMRMAIWKVLDEERATAAKAGISDLVVYEGILNTLTNAIVRIICEKKFSEDQSREKEREDRVRRMQRAISDAANIVLGHELGQRGGGSGRPYPPSGNN